jgi:hypothetical protein
MFGRGMQCLLEMDLDLAQQYLEESSKTVSAMHDHFSKANIAAVLPEAGKRAAEGLGLLISGQEAYVRTLRTAILGDVSRSDVEALKKAGRSFRDGADLISKAVTAAPAVFGGADLRPVAIQAGQLTRNLRTLCEQSISPKEITVTTAPKVVFYFVGTFVVLLIGLPVSGLVAKLQSSDLGLLLIVSLFVSVIGAFGFEAIRLIPLFEVFTRLLPSARQAEDKKGKAPDR